MQYSLTFLAVATAVYAQSQAADGQVQAPTAVVSQITDGQVQAPTGVSTVAGVKQITDGQIQAPTAVSTVAGVSQITDGQIQAPTAVSTVAGVKQITDGQIQAPTAVSTVAGAPSRSPTVKSRPLPLPLVHPPHPPTVPLPPPSHLPPLSPALLVSCPGPRRSLWLPSVSLLRSPCCKQISIRPTISASPVSGSSVGWSAGTRMACTVLLDGIFRVRMKKSTGQDS